MLETVRKHMREEDRELFEEETAPAEDEPAEQTAPQPRKSKKKSRRKDSPVEAATEATEEAPEDEAVEVPAELSHEEEKPKEKGMAGSTIFHTSIALTQYVQNLSDKKAKSKKTPGHGSKPPPADSTPPFKGPTIPVVSFCQLCNEQFDSRTKLFQHLRESGHATLKHLPAGDSSAHTTASGKGKKGKKERR